MRRIVCVSAALLAAQLALVSTSPVNKTGASACTEKVYVGDVYGGIAISQDAGETWGPLINPAGDPDNWIYAIYAIDDYVYAGTVDGTAVSANGGLQWTVHAPFPYEDQMVNCVFAVDKHVWAGVALVPIVTISDDNGQSWPISSQLPSPFGWIFDVRAIGMRTFVATTNGLGVSDDYATTWQYVCKAQGLASDYVTHLAVDGNNVYAAHDKNAISISEDGGQTWRIQRIPQIEAQDTAESLFVTNSKIYVGWTYGGLAISEDGGNTWVVKNVNDGLPSNQIHSVAAVDSNIYVVADGNLGALSVSPDGGQTWTQTWISSETNNIWTVFAQCA